MILLVTTNFLLLKNIPQTILEKYKPVKKVTIQKRFQNKTKISDFLYLNENRKMSTVTNRETK